MPTCKIHNIRFYNLEPKGIHRMVYEKDMMKLALSREDNSIEIWDLTYSPHIEYTIAGVPGRSVEGLAWCGPRLFSTGFKGIIVEYDLDRLSVKSEVPVTTGPAWCLGINKSRTKLAVGAEDGHINIYEILSNSIMYEKILDKQEGRISCLAWDSTGDFIITGSADVIRIWNVVTGHAIKRMMTGRSNKKQETVVWCVAVTEDFTIISGDSRGKICFFDGKMGIQVENFQSHKADILCLCLNDDESTVYCSGTDSVICSFKRVNMKPGDTRCKWVKSVQRQIHSHQVRAMVMANNKLCSAGVDGYLAMSSYPPKVLHKYPPLLQPPSVCVCRSSRCVLLRYRTYVEVWQLGETKDTSKEDGTLSLEKEPVNVLRLEAKEGDSIVCASLSDDAKCLVYSTSRRVRFCKLLWEKTVKLKKLKCDLNLLPVHKVEFFPSDTSLAILADSPGTLTIVRFSEDNIEHVHSIQTYGDNLLKSSVKILTVSRDGKYLAAADHDSNVIVWTCDDWKHHFTLPRYKCLPTAVRIQDEKEKMVVVYSDRKIVEVSLKMCKFTAFSKKLSRNLPTQWSSRGFAVCGVTFDPRNSNIIIMQDDSAVCIVNKDKEFADISSKIPRLNASFSDSQDSSSGHPHVLRSDHAFHLIKKYKHLVLFDWLADDEFVAVEISPVSLLETLPPVLRQKKFGM